MSQLMLERGARAAAEVIRQQDQDAAIKSGCDIHLAIDPYIQPARDIARAVLMAVREPDSDLQVEAWLWAPDEDYSDAQRLSDFTAMIDAILSETP